MERTGPTHLMPENQESPGGGSVHGEAVRPNPGAQVEYPGSVQAQLLSALAALGRSMAEKFDPKRSLEPFSTELLRMIPHNFLFINVLNKDGQTFSVLAEHDPFGLARLEEYYTPTFASQERYPIAEWVARAVFSGETMRVDDFQTDPRYDSDNPFARKVRESGLRSGLAVPLESGGEVIGALCAASLTPHAYTEAHLAAAQQVADLIGPFIDNVVQLQRERRWRLRLQALEGLTRILGGSLNIREAFNRLAEVVRPILDFDVMGVELFSASGREVEGLAEVGLDTSKEPFSIPLEHFSFLNRVAAGESVLINDARCELVPEYPGDRLIIDGGSRSSLIVPLRFGNLTGGALYFDKRKPNWYDEFDVEIAEGISAQVVLAVQHQRLAEEQRRLTEVEGRTRRLQNRIEMLRSEMVQRHGFDQIIGQALSLRESLTLSRKVAPTETTVLVTGESGTGKEVLARAIHYASPRAEGPFLTVSCAALPDTLLESELFGHERGAFTGADRQKPGRVELAAGGTLFLDEIGELPQPLQAKLLRVLQTHEFERLGGTRTLQADVRVIAATNRDLEKAVEAGRFREDLYYRLNVFRIHLPPLRERGNDVLLLADHFVRTLAARMGKAETGISQDARELLLAYPWPGNIRELQNAVERALIVSEGGLLTAAQLGVVSTREPIAPRVSSADSTDVPSLPEGSFAHMEKRLVLEALRKARGNKSKAAKLLGLTRSQLYTRLKRFDLDQ
ncbi:MAG: sigma 54-interacting transcriptional regulator [Candidatus Tectomicrobia bacterium]|uniref:Sigma 54-interacting transcriptional regulator n=1 Tax=Tectimicrobiota bacterium TaxID=2528274 RepID=A0A932GPJ1_UNCTE|nr:sigma 54-interacting transcriptional regulator [Candidatus Tectomicrobia bacterium]